ncbi:uncharacterized protein LOC120629688 [Pararge aegeria]|uniref:uncharacterized protein LOC120629688 n=1 Tax=Pararge aegeria TaxID=116150 RepID=UPI0019D12916|nr:uncharacterized protein LOC120629688 [Pararge aegeria]
MRHFGLSLFLCLQITRIYTSILTNPLKCSSLQTPCFKAFSDFDALTVDPLVLDYFKLERDDLEFEIKHTRVHGLQNMIIDEFRADSNTSMLHMKFRTDLLVTGIYKAAGSLFYMPMNGEGEYSASLKNVEIDTVAPFSIVRNAFGEDLIEASNYKFSYDIKDYAEYRLNNFYYGFSGFSELLHYLINNNWKYISTKYTNAFIANAVENVAKTRKTYFRLNPLQFLVQ